MTTDTPSRRKWHLNRWLIVLIVAMFGWSGWRAYAFRSALSQAKALGWEVNYADPVETIRKNWRAAFNKKTWLDGVTYIGIPTSEAFEQHLFIVHRLNPKALTIDNAATLRDLSALNNLTRLQEITLYHCVGLTSVDALKNFPALKTVSVHDCPLLTNLDALKSLSALKTVFLMGWTGLTNVDALKNLTALELVVLSDCTGLTNVDALKDHAALKHVRLSGSNALTKEGVAALRAALPRTNIISP